MSDTAERPSLENKPLAPELLTEAVNINATGAGMAELTQEAVKKIILAHREGLAKINERTQKLWETILAQYPELLPFQNELTIDTKTGKIIWVKDRLAAEQEGKPCSGCGKVHKHGEHEEPLYDMSQELEEMDFGAMGYTPGDLAGAGIGAMLNTDAGDNDPFIPQVPPTDAPPQEVPFEEPPPVDLDSIKSRTAEFLQGIGHNLGIGETPPQNFEEEYPDAAVGADSFVPASEIPAETPAPAFEEEYKAEEISAESFKAEEPAPYEAPAPEPSAPDTSYESSGGSFDSASSSDTSSSDSSSSYSDSGGGYDSGGGDCGGGCDGGGGGGD